MNEQIEKKIEVLSQNVEKQSQTINILIEITRNLSTIVDEGFQEVNMRLSKLEGAEGMKGVHTQLGTIKSELEKISMSTKYDAYSENLDFIRGTKGEA